MLSILIPVYNFDVNNLIITLCRQSNELSVPVEIICMDDRSDDAFRELNKNICNLKSVNYIELDNNIGRSAIRNKLAALASFDYLVFIDADTFPETNNFLKNYIDNIEKQTVVYGGRSYQTIKPVNSNFYLHWYYGSKREVKSVKIRNMNPYNSFMTNNFMIPKSFFSSIQFDESLVGYGHEDTLFGLELKKRNISIKHIDNPMIHIGLETAEVFLSKSEKAVENLLRIYKKYNLNNEIKILSYFLFFKKFRLHGFFKIIFLFFKKAIKKNILGKNPSLLLFDVYRLSYMIIVKNKF